MHWRFRSTFSSSDFCQLLSTPKDSKHCLAAVINISSISHTLLRLQPQKKPSLQEEQEAAQKATECTQRHNRICSNKFPSILNTHTEIQPAALLLNRTNSCTLTLRLSPIRFHLSHPLQRQPLQPLPLSCSPAQKGTPAGTCETATAATAASKAQAMWIAVDRKQSWRKPVQLMLPSVQFHDFFTLIL